MHKIDKNIWSYVHHYFIMVPMVGIFDIDSGKNIRLFFDRAFSVWIFYIILNFLQNVKWLENQLKFTFTNNKTYYILAILLHTEHNF